MSLLELGASSSIRRCYAARRADTMQNLHQGKLGNNCKLQNANFIVQFAIALPILFLVLCIPNSNAAAGSVIADEPREHAAKPVPADGLATLYPGDQGLERDPRVLFVENFETGTIPQIGKRWGEVRSPEDMELSADVSSG